MPSKTIRRAAPARDQKGRFLPRTAVLAMAAVALTVVEAPAPGECIWAVGLTRHRALMTLERSVGLPCRRPSLAARAWGWVLALLAPSQGRMWGRA